MNTLDTQGEVISDLYNVIICVRSVFELLLSREAVVVNTPLLSEMLKLVAHYLIVNLDVRYASVLQVEYSKSRNNSKYFRLRELNIIYCDAEEL